MVWVVLLCIKLRKHNMKHANEYERKNIKIKPAMYKSWCRLECKNYERTKQQQKSKNHNNNKREINQQNVI